jgi:hypothetical protein
MARDPAHQGLASPVGDGQVAALGQLQDRRRKAARVDRQQLPRKLTSTCGSPAAPSAIPAGHCRTNTTSSEPTQPTHPSRCHAQTAGWRPPRARCSTLASNYPNIQDCPAEPLSERVGVRPDRRPATERTARTTPIEAVTSRSMTVRSVTQPCQLLGYSRAIQCIAAAHILISSHGAERRSVLTSG